MAYVRPSATTADRQFSGAAYSRFAALSADAQFPSDYVATALAPGTAFGVPLLAQDQTAEAAGFQSTALGTPAAKPGYVPGFLAGGTGTPTGRQQWTAASLGLLTRFSTAYVAFPQTALPAGFAAVRFGTPVSTTIVEGVPTTITSAAGFRTTRLGVPAGAKFEPAGWASTTFGAPLAKYVLSATGRSATQFGTAIGSPSARALGFRSTGFGEPLAGFQRTGAQSGWRAGALGAPKAFRPSRATSVAPRSRFGTPAATAPNARQVFGIDAGRRFGVPRASAVLGYRASALLAASGLGTPAALHKHRALHIAPSARFGAALVVRDGTC